MKWPFQISSWELGEGCLKNAPSTLFLVEFFFATQQAVLLCFGLKVLKSIYFLPTCLSLAAERISPAARPERGSVP